MRRSTLVMFPAVVLGVVAFVVCNQGSCTALSSQLQTRRAFTTASANAVFLSAPAIATAFDGSGSSAYSGRTPLEKAAKAKSYRDRIVADVRDFNRLGASISKGEVDGDAWVGFFIPYQRREPDPVGRTYAALLDLIGVEKSGGAALLLATTYAKPNKPPNNLPQYRKYENLLKNFDGIKAAGQAGDANKAKSEWSKAAVVLADYLESVELPSDLSDATYK